MQKARRHPPEGGLRPLVSARVQVLFHSPSRRSFHLSLTVLVHYRSSPVFSLAGWCRPVRTGFLRSRPTQGSPPESAAYAYGAVTRCGAPFQCASTWHWIPSAGPATPGSRRSRVWAVPRSLATTGGITGLFSVPPPTEMFQFGGLASSRTGEYPPTGGWVAPFGNLRIRACVRLPAAFRSLSRPSSPGDA